MEAMIALGVSFVLGHNLLYQRKIADDAYKVLNAVIVNIAMPAIILKNIYSMQLTANLMIVGFVPWLIYGMSLLYFILLGRLLGWGSATVGALVLTAGYGNNAFIGLPLIEALFGREWLGVGAVFAQVGITLGTNTAGVLTAAWFSGGGGVSARRVLIRVLSFPPFQAFVAGFACKLVAIPAPALQALGIIGSMLGPLVMISVGMQLRFAGARELAVPIGVALVCKLLLAPVVALAVLLATGIGGTLAQVVMLQASVAPGITGAIIAAEFALNKRIPPFVISSGTIVSALTIPAWLMLARWIFP